MYVGLTIFFVQGHIRGTLPEDSTIKNELIVFLTAPWVSWFGVVVFGGAVLVDQANKKGQNKN